MSPPQEWGIRANEDHHRPAGAHRRCRRGGFVARRWACFRANHGGTARFAGPLPAHPRPDAGYQPIIDLIRSAVSSVRMTMYELADDDAVTALADAHRRGVDVKVILDPHSTVSTPTKQPTMRFTPPASTSNGRPMMRSITRNHRRRPHYRRRRYRKPHQEVLRDLARCLHSHHQHQRRRRHRRHLRHPLHRRAPRK